MKSRFEIYCEARIEKTWRRVSKILPFFGKDEKWFRTKQYQSLKRYGYLIFRTKLTGIGKNRKREGMKIEGRYIGGKGRYIYYSPETRVEALKKAKELFLNSKSFTQRKRGMSLAILDGLYKHKE